jgi:hypothetical protein
VRFKANLQYLQAWSALHASPKADFSGAFTSMQRIYGDALSSIPYLTGGRGGDELAQSEREAAVERYKAYKAQVLKPSGASAGKPAGRVKPIRAAKHKGA